MVFKNRIEAGRKLAKALERYRGGDVVVYALPRGGVVLGAEVARYLGAPLDLIIPRKIGHPLSPEYAIGAVTETGQPIWNKSELGFTDLKWREDQVKAARQEARRRRVKYSAGLTVPEVEGKTAVIVDDGIATGLTMVAAIRDLLKRGPKSVVVAVAVAPESIQHDIADYADEYVVLNVLPGYFGAIGAYYEDFPQVDDEEVRGLMDAYHAAPADEPLDLAGINAVLATIKRYPITSSEMAAQARRLHSPKNVVQFFESIPGDTEFQDRIEIMRRSEEAEVIMEEEADQPAEKPRSYDDAV